MWVFDQGTHFKSEVATNLARTCHVLHHHTVGYSPWGYSTFESSMQSVLAVERALVWEWKLAPSDWGLVISTVMTALNLCSLECLGYRKDGIA